MALPKTLSQWLDYQQQTHSQEIALGLDRVKQLASALGITRPAEHCIVVGGTNGKGSTVAFLEAIVSAAGYSVGAYTSPHLLRYQERIRLNGVNAEESALIGAFARIENARGEIPLTFFEFGTLAALLLMQDAELDVAVLEVGLGGRLDAVNIMDADAAIVTSVDLDHQQFLGPDRESIGFEKAGIFRKSKPAIVGDAKPPSRLIDHAFYVGAKLALRGQHFHVNKFSAKHWRYQAEDGYKVELPIPKLLGDWQLANAACAIHAMRQLPLQISETHMQLGVAKASVLGRLQHFHAGFDLYIDVAHNPHAAGALAQWLAQNPVPGETWAVFGALSDKDVAQVCQALQTQIDHWILLDLSQITTRGLSSTVLADRCQQAIGASSSHAQTFEQAIDLIEQQKTRPSRVLVFGSFFSAGQALDFFQHR